MLKKQARTFYKKKRDAISYTEKMKWDDLMLIQFQTLDLPYLDYVLSYYPIEENNEVNTFLLTDYLHFKNLNLHICYPKTNTKAYSMDAVACSADSIFEENEYNIPEPLETSVVDPGLIDLVFIPMLGYDKKGNRVGYGKGFYDRYLKECRTDCLKIGLSYFEPLEAIEDANEFDISLDFCITPQRIYVF